MEKQVGGVKGARWRGVLDMPAVTKVERYGQSEVRSGEHRTTCHQYIRQPEKHASNFWMSGSRKKKMPVSTRREILTGRFTVTRRAVTEILGDTE